MPDDTILVAKSLAHQASKISWVIGLISILLLAISRGAPVIVELTVPILILAGVACGVAALIGIRRHAVGGVRVPAIAGLVINGLLLSFFAYNLLFVGDGPHSQRAKQARAQAAAQINETPNDPKPGEGSAASFALTAAGNADSPADNAETRYLVFQVQTGLYGYASQFHPPPGRFSLTKAQIAEFVRDVVKAIGMKGDARHKLAFAVGPLCFDMPDEETRQFIHDAFAVARENDVAVAFHIDDSICWGQRKDLLANPDNIETAAWKQIPNTGRRADWGPKPTKFVPQMCFNSPAIVAAAKDRGTLIGAEVKKEMDALKAAGKEHLFAGVIAGWETQMGRDFDTDRSLGYRALSHRGFSESHPPKDADLERVSIVKEWMELWGNSLHGGGIPCEKIFCHIVFTSQGLDPKNLKTGGGSKFSPPEVAFSSAYRPGFSTYPEGATFKAIFSAVAEHGSPGWISGEGCNVSPTGMPGEPNMETYLGRLFNHGAVMVNIFSWGIGGEAMRNNFFRRATEGPECLAAYAKFLRGEKLVETARTGFSSEMFQEKMHEIQAELPGWMEKAGLTNRLRAMWHMHNIQSYMKEKKWQELDKEADEVLAVMKSAPVESKTGSSTATEGLPSKMQKIQSGLPSWIGSDADRKNKATALTQQLQQHLKASNFEEAGKTADSILKMIGGSAQGAAQDIPTEAKTDTATPKAPGTPDEEARAHFLHELGGPFFVSRDKVQEDLKLSDDQKHKLRETLTGYVQETMKVQKLDGAERKQAMQSLRQKSYQQLEVFLKEILTPEQLKRFAELKLQYDMPMAMLQPDIVKELNITDEQRQQFITLIQEMQKVVAPLIQESRSGGNPKEILAKVTKLRLDCQGKIEALLSDAQKTRWKEMTGTPLVIW